VSSASGHGRSGGVCSVGAVAAVDVAGGGAELVAGGADIFLCGFLCGRVCWRKEENARALNAALLRPVGNGVGRRAWRAT
jgi:hypothetical protein